MKKGWLEQATDHPLSDVTTESPGKNRSRVTTDVLGGQGKISGYNVSVSRRPGDPLEWFVMHYPSL
jgi:hypothetical protein